MSLVLSHETALNVYRSSLMPHSDLRHMPFESLSLPRSEDSTAFRSLPVRFAHKSFHCVVPEAKDRREIRYGHCHVHGDTMQVVFVRCLSEESLLCVVPPEVLFLNMAATSSLVELVKLGYELCGGYSLFPAGSKDVNPSRSFIPREPLTTAAKLGAYVYAAGHSRSVRKARMALRYIVDGSASPKETELCMLLVMPRRMGGYGFEKPLISHSSDVLARMVSATPSSGACSLLWCKAHVAVEYSSVPLREGGCAEKADRSYRRLPSSLGFKVVNVTDWHIYEAENLDKIAKAVASKQGKSLRMDTRYDFAVRQTSLRKQVLGEG